MPHVFPFPSAWPGFRNGRLLLPLPPAWFSPVARTLGWQGLVLHVKHEFHVTLLNQAVGRRVRDALGQAQVKRLFEEQDWSISRCGDGVLLQKEKHQKRPTPCASLIEHIALPSLGRFRAALARNAGIELPDVPAHVTLYAAGDPAGIGLSSHQALRASTVATLRLPGIASRPPPPLQEQQHSAYCAATYALDVLDTSVQIGAHCPIVTAELLRRNVERAAIITAYNPFSSQAHDVGNHLRQQWLIAAVQQEGLHVVEAEGSDPDGSWTPEPSLLVFGTTPELEDRLLRAFEQHAIVVVTRNAPAQLVLHPDQPTAQRP